MADEKTKDETTKIELDPRATLQERMFIADVKTNAMAGAARMVEDLLTNRILVLATHNTELMAANIELSARIAELEAKGESK